MEKKKASLLLKYFCEVFWNNFSFLNKCQRESYCNSIKKKITVLVLARLKEHLSSNVPMTTPETQNTPLPGHSASLGCVYTVNHSLLQMQLHGASQWHKLSCLIKAHSLLRVFTPAVWHEALVESRTGL